MSSELTVLLVSHSTRLLEEAGEMTAIRTVLPHDLNT